MNNFNLRKYLAENILLKESQDLVSRIGDLEDILWNGGNRRAEKEWEIVSGEYLPGEQGAEHWDDLDDYDLRSAIDDAEHIMKKYEMGEEVNEGYEDQLFLKSKMKQSFLEGWKSAQLPTKQTDVQAFERFWNKQSVEESINEVVGLGDSQPKDDDEDPDDRPAHEAGSFATNEEVDRHLGYLIGEVDDIEVDAMMEDPQIQEYVDTERLAFVRLDTSYRDAYEMFVNRSDIEVKKYIMNNYSANYNPI